MDLRLLATTFSAIFLAELGDKTQLATLAFSGESSSKWTVFTGSALALVTSSAIAVLAGGWVGRHVPPIWLRRAAGALFLVLGGLTLLRASK
jgi:putative Ca2+/H+ antiporter (TMEM165/GDT1 family)